MDSTQVCTSEASEAHIGITVPHQRKPISPAFRTPQNPVFTAPQNLPFMPLQLGNTPHTKPLFPHRSPFSYEGEQCSTPLQDVEPPLLEELGINMQMTRKKLVSAMNPIRINHQLHEDDADLFGPFMVCMAMGVFQLLWGKFQFGVITGWMCLASLYLYVILNMLAGRHGNLNLYKSLSIVGYSMLPMAMFSAVRLFIPQSGVLVFAIAGLAVIWCTRVCTSLMVAVAPQVDHQLKLVAYASSLVFMLFSLLVVF